MGYIAGLLLLEIHVFAIWKDLLLVQKIHSQQYLQIVLLLDGLATIYIILIRVRLVADQLKLVMHTNIVLHLNIQHWVQILQILQFLIFVFWDIMFGILRIIWYLKIICILGIEI